MPKNESYNVLFARLMNLSYAQYLRFCRDILDAELVGKNKIYPIPYFVKNPKTVAFVRMLNTEMNLIMWEREHPDWMKNIEYINQKTTERIKIKEKVLKNVSDS